MFIFSLLKNERKSYLFSETQYSQLFTVLYIIVDKIIKYLTISHNLFTMNFSMFKIRIFDGDYNIKNLWVLLTKMVQRFDCLIRKDFSQFLLANTRKRKL